MSREDLDALSERLRPHYSRVLGGLDGGILLTGHSHQAWPDVSRAAQIEAWDDAAALVDDKWSKIFGVLLPALRARIATRMGSVRPDDIAIAPNTHELGYRVLSCFGPAPKVVTTDSEFHSLRRQLDRLEEDGAEICRLAVDQNLVREMASVLADGVDLLMLSSVLYLDSTRIDLDPILRLAADHSVPVVVDAYHAFNVVGFEADRFPGEVFVIAGGYKYAQCGEGICFMLCPRTASRFRPKQTGWFADFGALTEPRDRVSYGPGGERFLGSTFDPTAVYRALRVLEWMDEMGLDLPTLRGQSTRQTEYMISRAEALGVLSSAPLVSPRAAGDRGGFVAFRVDDAAGVCGRLADAGIRTDYRGPYLRFGPAPFTLSAEIDRAMEAFRDALSA